MPNRELQLEEQIFSIKTPDDFLNCALQVFKFQYSTNSVYKSYVDARKINPNHVDCIQKIPFLPISFFKTHVVTSSRLPVKKTFESSGTTGDIPSKHYVCVPEIYNRASCTMFESLYGKLSEYVIIALLPSYLERENSSLVYMMQQFMSQSNYKESGFFLHAEHEFISVFSQYSHAKILCVGVSFALVDFAQKHSVSHPHTIVMETGGMKGRSREIIREELHNILMPAFGVSSIHSEYGMTELLSQSYAKQNGEFVHPPWMRVLIRDLYDPYAYLPHSVSGGLNIIDLANLYSCSFIETQDIGRKISDTCFTVEGRIDSADIRGCSLMI